MTKSTKTVVVLSGVLLLLCLFGFMLKQQFITLPSLFGSDGGEVVIVLTDVGYEPSDVTISVGTTITFTTTRDTFHWPASNLHPNHTIYPEFDPLAPVPPEENWSFTFDKAGKWNFHDHLRSYYRGTITVIE